MYKFTKEVHSLATGRSYRLRDLLKAKDLPVYGAKAELIERLQGG
jgi:hypothetical protein